METLRQLLEVQWTKRDGTPDYKMIDHCLKSHVYIQSGDCFIHVGQKKPGIDSDMWYDDETDGPAETFANFYDYNMRGQRFTLPENAHFVTTHYHNDRTGGKLLAFTINDYSNPRPATAEEIDKANAALRDVMNDYGKRLRTYWKRYSDKVHARGYWANR